jgi:predicted RNA binding protein YcfA (HicA-like mRNA interferase family)
LTSRQPRVTAAQVIRILENLGFELARQSGSYKIDSIGNRVDLI